MKNVFVFALLLAFISFSSCKKSAAAPESTTTVPENNTIKVQYRVSAPSGQMNVQYTINEGGEVKIITSTINRLTFSYSFEWNKGEMLSVLAKNTIPSDKSVTVEIYVNGTLFKTGQTNTSGGLASAEGIYN